MTLNKIFYFEFISGILFLSFPILCFFIHISSIALNIAYVIYILIFLFYVNFFQKEKHNKNGNNWGIVNVAWAISGIIPLTLTALTFVYGSKIRIYTGESFKQYLPLYFVSLWLLFHSILSVLLLNLGWAENGITGFRKSIIELFNSDSYIEIKRSFFILIIFIGIFFVGFDYYQILTGRLFTVIPPLIMIAYVYDYKSKIKNKQKRKFDEREKNFLFQTISIATFFFIILLSVLFMIKDVKLLGHLLNEMWGIIIFPLFLILWGFIGLVMLRKE